MRPNEHWEPPICPHGLMGGWWFGWCEECDKEDLVQEHNRENAWGSFEADHLICLDLALTIDPHIPEYDPDNRFVRCHEVARMLSQWLTTAKHRVVDGVYGSHDRPAVDHSWIEIEDRQTKRIAILDPYAVGRLPRATMVTTLDPHQLHRMYREGPKRGDIRFEVVDWLYNTVYGRVR